MAKTFYSVEEAASRLGVSADDLKGLVRSGKLREFRDAGKVNYKVEEVDKLSIERGLGGSGGSGELLLEPAEGSSIHLAPMGGSDAIRLSDTDLEDTAAGMKARKDKGGSVVPSVGVSVFDEEDIKSVDPLAETVMAADSDPLGIEGTGSGSGLLDLTRESDDTSLGAELLDEISPAEGSSMQMMGDATRAGLEQAIVEPKGEAREAAVAGPSVAAPRVRQVVEYGPDPMSIGMGAMTAIAVLVMLFTGLGAASVGRGVWPSFMNTIYTQLWIYGLGALVVAILALVIGYFLGKRAA